MANNKFNFADMLRKNAEKLSALDEENEVISKPSETNSHAFETIETTSEIVTTSSKKEKKKRNWDSVKRERNKIFNMRLSDEEFEEVEEKIAKSKLKRTDFFLKSVRNTDVVVIENLNETRKEFQKQGANINQIAKALNGYYLQLKQYGLETYGIEEDFQKFYSEVLKLREENKKTIEMLDEISERIN